MLFFLASSIFGFYCLISDSKPAKPYNALKPLLENLPSAKDFHRSFVLDGLWESMRQNQNGLLMDFKLILNSAFLQS
jgi:hypothetical protein